MTKVSQKIQMVDTVGQYEHIREEVDREVLEVIRSGAFINGPWVKQFASHLESYLDAKHVIPCANGTDALQIALMALDLQPGDEVITPTFTFFATAEVVALLNLRPVFVDVEPGTFNMDVSKIEAAITDKTKVILPVHLFGQSVDMGPLIDIAKKHDLKVIEDNAQAIGSNYRFPDGTERKAGTIGDIGCTSFYPSKNLGAYGDGGAIFTNDDALAEKLRMICNHGTRVKYYHETIGVNSRLDSIQAAILDIKLKKLDEYNDARRQAAAWYDENLRNVDDILIPHRADYSRHVFHQYTIRIKEGREKRDQVKTEMDRRGIPNMIYYPVPLHLQEAYEPFGFKQGDFPVAEQLSAEVLSLPMHTELTEDQVKYICQNLIESLKH